MIYVAVGIIFSLALVSLGIKLIADAQETQGTQELEDLARSLQKELLTASQTQPGYHRIVNLPKRLSRGDYSISNDEESFTLTHTSGAAITLSTPQLNGTLTKGNNLIYHAGNNTLTITT